MMVSSLAAIFDQPIGGSEGPLLSLSDVTVRFGGINALSDVTFDVGNHELVSIIGPNGAGKTTTLNAICHIIESTGRITFRGRSLEKCSSAQVAMAGIGRSFQDPPLVEQYTVLENVLCGTYRRLSYGMPSQVFRRKAVSALEREMTERAMTLLDFVGLADEAGVTVGSLPYGSRKLVDIARAIVSGPQLLLLDEPSSGLDAEERASLQATLLTLREKQCVGILVVEHHMDLVRAVSTRVIALQAGSVAMSGTPSEVLDSDLFRAVVLGTPASSVSAEDHMSMED